MTAQQTPPTNPQDDNSYVDSYQPPSTDVVVPQPGAVPAPIEPAPVPAVPAVDPAAITPVPTQDTEKTQALQDQNIFFLLGVEDSTEEEKEAFLDELQQIIWEDFVENDVKALISEVEMTQLKEIMSKGDSIEVQEEMVVFLEKLIPDLEEIMLEKALELKEEMVMERIAGMAEYHTADAEAVAKIDEAKQLFSQDKWHQGGEVLNTIVP